MSDGPQPTEFDLGCFFHGYEGDITPEKQPYRVCGECGHLFWTVDQLIEEFNHAQVMCADPEVGFHNGPVIEVTNPDEVFFCCWCAHDF